MVQKATINFKLGLVRKQVDYAYDNLNKRKLAPMKGQDTGSQTAVSSLFVVYLKSCRNPLASQCQKRLLCSLNLGKGVSYRLPSRVLKLL